MRISWVTIRGVSTAAMAGSSSRAWNCGLADGSSTSLASGPRLPPERYPALARVRQAGVTHDPDRLFTLALDGLLLALQASRPAS